MRAAVAHSTDAPLPCHECGYDVRRTLADGLRSCPECGAAISEKQSVEKAIESSVNRAMRRAAIAAVVVFFLGLFFSGELAISLAGAICVAGGARCAWLLTNCPHPPEGKGFLGLALGETFGTALYALVFSILPGLLLGIVMLILVWL